MKIPENFKQKYQLKGESYPSANADAALSELFAVSGRLYKENADLKAEIARLREEAKNAAPAPAAEVDLSGVEALIASLAEQIASIRTTVNDTLCVVNDAAISAKKAEDSAKEAKTAAEETRTLTAESAGKAQAKAQDILEAIDALGDKLDGVPTDVIPMIFEEEPVEEIAPVIEEESVEEIAPVIEEIAPVIEEETPEVIEEPIPEEEEEVVSEEENELLEEVAVMESFEDEPELPEEELEELEIKDGEEDQSFADELIRFAGLDSEPEEIEPADEVGDEDLTAKLNEMYSKDEESESEPEPAPEEEKPAPTSFTDMKSALDAIRARLKK